MYRILITNELIYKKTTLNELQKHEIYIET